jgi:hypothetical protein
MQADDQCAPHFERNDPHECSNVRGQPYDFGTIIMGEALEPNRWLATISPRSVAHVTIAEIADRRLSASRSLDVRAIDPRQSGNSFLTCGVVERTRLLRPEHAPAHKLSTDVRLHAGDRTIFCAGLIAGLKLCVSLCQCLLNFTELLEDCSHVRQMQHLGFANWET